jgi:predicted RNA-binding Zn-ribbon protein involved in translation (DUF1610 family)
MQTKDVLAKDITSYDFTITYDDDKQTIQKYIICDTPSCGKIICAAGATIPTLCPSCGNATEDNCHRSSTAMEYTVDYSDPDIKGTVYNADVNYRFITFNKFRRTAVQWSSDQYQFIIRLVPYFSDQEDKLSSDKKASLINDADKVIKSMKSMSATPVSGLSIEGVATSFSIPAADFAKGKDILGQDYAITLKNSYVMSNPETGGWVANIEEDVSEISGKIHVENEKHFTGVDSDEKWTESDTQYYVYVKVGDDAANSSYYDKCMVEFDVNTGKYQVCDSKVSGDEYPKAPYVVPAT